jgi:GR25 family glycosyltransferase involved in LPS biosynthesis
MKIDLREIQTIWINLDSATINAEFMRNRFEKFEFLNTHRKSARIIPAPSYVPRGESHFMGCGQSHIDILDDKNYKTPFLILEDDIEFSSNFTPIIDIPEDSDGIYLGVSHGNYGYKTCKKDENYLRISGVLAAHAILYVNDKFRSIMSYVAKKCLYEFNCPWDLGSAQIQSQLNVYTPNLPFFYQSNDRHNANKTQSLTENPLQNRNCIF